MTAHRAGVGADARPDGRTWATAAVALLLLAAWWLGPAGHGGSGGDTGAAVAAAVAADHPPHVYAPHAPLPAAAPTRLDVPSIGVHASLVGRDLTDGTIDPPPYDTPGVAGWYRGGPAPGAPGAAVIVGHVDTETGPAVFYALSTVQRGAVVDVTRTDGTVAEFSVEAVEVVQKDHFDASRVYGSGTGRPELRLITCGGSFDRTQQEYSANVVVYAALTGSHPVAR
ncbi:Sortase family protein [Actinacidiphila rubida]|uniref:Sortase family protein n=1 Tax=Actinacidiphila rubida TaxID=310780 RepID=A0A1H8HYV3_9ACTN|nr:class F sortase [Actinacidiphila rubida]SEN61292.1 Sortase family protein [Actinacidiphila rubida]